MPNLNAVLNDQIRRLAGREIFARKRAVPRLDTFDDLRRGCELNFVESGEIRPPRRG